jgi:large subunit ribosomal protein L24
MKLKKGDDIIVLSGKYRGERGTVESAQPAKNTVILDALNVAKRHTKTQGANIQAGIIDKAMPLDASNVALWCNAHKGPARLGYDIKESGEKIRVCRNCGTAL